MSSDQDQVIRWIREICLHDQPETALSEDSALLEEGLLDSMKVVQLVGFLEDLLGRPLPIDEVTAENFESPKRIAAMIRRLRETGDEPGSGRS